MKEYIDQIFYEGLGKSLYYPVEKKIEKINNKSIKKNLMVLFKFIYFLFSLFIAICLLYYKL